MKFNTVKSKVLLFLSILTLLGTIFCIVSCDNFLSQNLGKTTININLDLSKLIKNSRNDDTQINGYVLKLFVYYAKNYQEGDKEIENLPLLTQTSNKVDINGTVKASLELSIASTVIFVGKLFTLNENNIESDKPLYAGKSEVFKVQPKDNKVHLVLSRDKAEIGFEIELQETHEHTFAEEWSASLSHHWKGTTCGHNDVMADFTEHSFSDWTTTLPATEEVAGSKERTCEECNYKEVVEIANLAHTHKFEEKWSASLTHHWKEATCGHNDVMADFTEHSFSDWTTTEPTEEEAGSKERTCDVCNYKETAEIAQLVHTHKFAEEWSTSLTHHWKAATCVHTENVTNFGEHTYPNGVCICGMREMVLIQAGTFQMGSEQGFDDNKPILEVRITKDFYMGKYEVTQAEYEQYCTYGGLSPSSDYGDGDNYPAYYVSWYDALVYCNKRSINEGLTPCYRINEETDPTKWGTVPTSSDSTWNAVVCDWEADGYRLPTEAEWEYAARAGDNTVDTLIYSGTNKLGEYAWYSSNSSSKTHEVGTKKANAFGLYDMSGNVSEWCWNWYTSSYNTTTEGGNNPTGTLSGSIRVSRGGGWGSSSSYCSDSSRSNYNPYGRSHFLGLRLVRASSN